MLLPQNRSTAQWSACFGELLFLFLKSWTNPMANPKKTLIHAEHYKPGYFGNKNKHLSCTPVALCSSYHLVQQHVAGHQPETLLLNLT